MTANDMKQEGEDDLFPSKRLGNRESYQGGVREASAASSSEQDIDDINNNLMKPTKKYPLADHSKTKLYADEKDPKKI
jgi:hypothetical protein